MGWADKVEGLDNSSENPPTIPGLTMKLLNYPNSITKSLKTKLGITSTRGESIGRSLWNIESNQIYPAPTPEIINSDDFGILVSYGRNTSSNEGFILLNYLRLYIEWTNPEYSLSVDSEQKSLLFDDEIIFMVTLKNTNNIHQGKDVKVHIGYDSSLSLVNYSDDQGKTYDDSIRIWNAKLDDDGIAKLLLRFNAEEEGILECRAQTDFNNIKNSSTVDVFTPNVEVQANFQDPVVKIIKDDNFSYDIIATTNNDLFTKKDIKLPILEGLKLESFECDGNYNTSTEIWSAKFKNKKAYFKLNIIPTSTGNFLQNITIDGEDVFTKEFIVMDELANGDYQLENSLYSDGLQYLKDSEKFSSTDSDDDSKESDSSLYSYEKKTVIEADNITMEFTLNPEKIDNFKEYFIKFIKRKIKNQEFLALNDVSFTLEKGDRLGLIGLNGAGKSTLLKIIAGVMKPSKGSIDVYGKIAPLLELGAGFDPNYTGKENIFLNGSILGYSKEFIEEKYEEIAEFSELGRFLDVPIKNYSSGMKSKLGFSIATIVDPDILILDEVLSVGDAKFRKKSSEKIQSLFESGVTVLLVSHAISQIRELCNKVLWLEDGKVKMMGSTEEVCDAYEDSIEMD